ncbi:hypothetical protein ACTFIZ_012143 [Dictyostelium cf. discoideum]
MNMAGFKETQMKAIETLNSIKKPTSSTNSAFKYIPKISSGGSGSSSANRQSSIYTANTLRDKQIKEKPSNRIVYDIVNYLKTLEGIPADTKEIMHSTNHMIDDKPEILELLRNNEKIIDHGNDRFSFKPKYNVRTQRDILDLLPNYPGGILVSELAESYNNAESDVKKLKETKQIFAIKAAESACDIIFPNDDRLRVPLSQELVDMWKSIKLPNEADLEKEMKDAGLSVVESVESARQTKSTKFKKERKKRITKVTNTHIENFNPNDDVPQLGSKPI